MRQLQLRPLFQHRDRPEQVSRRLLLVSYHFPPDPTIGARRWEGLAPFVAERGWGLDVVTCAPPPGADLRRLEALPRGVSVVGVPAVTLRLERFEHLAWRGYRALRDPGGAASAGPGAARRAAAPTTTRPDWLDRSQVRWGLHTSRALLRVYWTLLQHAKHRAWARRAASTAQMLFAPGVHMVVATSGPPHLTHEAGREVSELTGLPFVMDMRDPWSLAQRIPEGLASPLWLRLARRYEGAAVRRAALVVANTDAARDALAAEYPSATERLLTVMNGSDDESLPRAIAEHRFTIAYAGTIYDLDGPQSLFRAAASVIRELGLGPDDFGIDFIGADTPRQRSLIEMARAENIAEFVSVGPSRPHGEALDFLARATMLVIFPGWDVTAIPAKIFEYVRFAAWVLTLCDPGSATDRLLRGLDVDVVRPADIAAIAAGILRHYREHRRGVRPSRPVTDDRFSRRTQARILLDAIARIAPRDSDNPRRQRIPA